MLNKPYFLYFSIIFVLFSGCLSNPQYYLKTIEYDSDIIYNDTIEIYKLFANHSLTKEFNPVISNFYVLDFEFYNNEINNKYKIFTLFSNKELTELQNNIYFDNIQQYIDDNFFDNNILGIVFVPFYGLQYLKNEKLINKNNNLIFSVEVWDQKSDAVPALANRAIYLLRIKK